MKMFAEVKNTHDILLRPFQNLDHLAGELLLHRSADPHHHLVAVECGRKVLRRNDDRISGFGDEGADARLGYGDHADHQI